MKTRRIAFSLMFAGLGLAALHCGGSVATDPTNDTCFGCDLGDGGGPPPGVPAMHRPSAPACSMDRAPGIVDAGPNPRDAGFPGSCEVDADCTQGKNGRCGYFGGGLRSGPACSYDECFTDSECGANQLCDCAANGAGNTCIASNCRIDGDCGAGGYCSPTYDEACGTYSGYVGYYCRTPRDGCVNDSECNDGKKAGLCVWEKEVSKWACSYNQCVG